MTSRRIPLIVVIAASVAVGWLGATVRPAAAADGYTQTAATTYVVDPDHDQLEVSVTVKVRNLKPNVVTSTQVTRYYLDRTAIWIENGASRIEATSGGASLAVKLGAKGTYYRTATVSFPNLYYGSSRTIRVSYVVKGGAPRSASAVRVLHAYASFCVVPNGLDSGSVTVRAPKAYAFTTSGKDMASSDSGATRIYSSGKVLDTASFWACFDGVNDAGYRVQTMTGPGGMTIILRSWPEDAAWVAAVRADIEAGLPALATLIGKPLNAQSRMFVQEAATGGEYAGFYDEDTNTITVDEDFNQPSLVQHELAHAWFNFGVFDDQWLSEGSAEWAARTVAQDQPPCTKPDAGSGVIDLSDWLFLSPRSTVAERDAVTTEYDAACYIVTQAADAAGADRMATALTALLNGRDPYSADPHALRAGRVATWKDWLDAVDELALAPAGASETLLPDLLVHYGVTSNAAQLDERETARAAFHDLEAEVGDWVVPTAVRAPLSVWDFTAAEAAVKAAEPAWQLTGEADAALPGIDARHGPAARAWAAASDKADLDAAAQLAQQQLDAAKDVASTLELAAQPLDLEQQVGLLGASIPDAHPAVDAVRDDDFSRASGITASVRDAIASLRDTGQLRLTLAGLVAATLLVLLALVIVLRVRSGRRRRLALAMAAAAASTEAATAPTPSDAMTISAPPVAPDATTTDPAVEVAGDGPPPPLPAPLAPTPPPLAPPPPPPAWPAPPPAPPVGPTEDSGDRA